MSIAAPAGATFLSSLALVAAMGFRHGFDADHIAVVDGMTRARQLQGGYWTSRIVGAQFAIGHSATILLASVLLHGQSANLPSWLDGLGLVVSTCFLLLVGWTNLAHAVRPTACGTPSGLVSSAVLRVGGHRLHPLLVGMAFAFSFDALAQAAYFASRGSQFSGLGAVVMLASVFGLGMLVADAANGALLNWFASRSDRMARHASRFSSGFVAFIALGTAVAGLARQFAPALEAHWEAHGVWVGVGLLGFTCIVYSLRLLFQRVSSGATAGH